VFQYTLPAPGLLGLVAEMIQAEVIGSFMKIGEVVDYGTENSF